MAKNKFLNREIKVSHEEKKEVKKDHNQIVINIDPSELDDNIFQPRLSYDEDRLGELIASIKKDGQQVPIKITNNPDSTQNKYMIVFGHRRSRACQALGIKVKAFVEDIGKTKLRSLALIENIQRDDLSVIELAISLRNSILDGTFSSQKELAGSTGFSEAKISALFAILNLDNKIVTDLEKSRVVKDVNALALLNKLESKHLQYQYYIDFKEGRLDRKNLTRLLNSKKSDVNSQCELNLSKSKISYYFRPSKKLTKEKYKIYEEFTKNKLEELRIQMEDKEKELLG